MAAPPEMKLQVDRRGDGVPEMRVDRARELAIYTFATTLQPQLFAGAVVDAVRRVPAVGARGLGAVDAGVEGLPPTTGSSWPGAPTATCRALAAEVTRGARQRRARRCAPSTRWVRRHIKGGGGALDEAATSILAREEGNRITLEAALLDGAAGVPSRIWLAHPPRDAQLDGQLPDLEGFDEPLLAAGGVWIDPRYRHAPTGFVSPPLRGGARLRAGAGQARVGARADGQAPTIARWTSTCTWPPTARRR